MEVSSNLLAKLKAQTKLARVEKTQTCTRGGEIRSLNSRNSRGDLEEKAKNMSTVEQPSFKSHCN